MVHIIAVDPGKMTGVCEVDKTGWTVWSAPAMSACARIEARMRSDTILVSERFVFTTPKITPQYDALEVIGVLRYLGLRFRRPFELQGRADRKRVSLEVLRQFVTKWEDDHQFDAAQHGVVAAYRHGLISAASLAARIDS